MRVSSKNDNNTVGSPASNFTNETTGFPEIDAIHEQCFNELTDVVIAIAEINEVNTNTIMNIQVRQNHSYS